MERAMSCKYSCVLLTGYPGVNSPQLFLAGLQGQLPLLTEPHSWQGFQPFVWFPSLLFLWCETAQPSRVGDLPDGIGVYLCYPNREWVLGHFSVRFAPFLTSACRPVLSSQGCGSRESQLDKKSYW